MRIWSTYLHQLNRLPPLTEADVRVEDPCRPVLGDLIRPGALVKTNYGTGPYLVDAVKRCEYQGFTCWSLAMRAAPEGTAPDGPSHAWIGDLIVEFDGEEPRFRKIYRDNDDEVFVIGAGVSVGRSGQYGLLL